MPPGKQHQKCLNATNGCQQHRHIGTADRMATIQRTTLDSEGGCATSLLLERSALFADGLQMSAEWAALGGSFSEERRRLT